MLRQLRTIHVTEGHPLVPALCNACWYHVRVVKYVTFFVKYVTFFVKYVTSSVKYVTCEISDSTISSIISNTMYFEYLLRMFALCDSTAKVLKLALSRRQSRNKGRGACSWECISLF